MGSKQAKRIPESEVPEVLRFLEAKRKLDALREGYPEVFESLQYISEEYNAAIEAADKILRAKQVSCGPFDLFQTQTTYDPDKLFQELGKEEFLRVGGSIKTVTQYEVDKAKLEAHITSNAIPEDVVKEVRKVTPKFKKPDKVSF